MRPEDIPERETVFAIPPIWVIAPIRHQQRAVGGQIFETEQIAIAWISAALNTGDWQRSYAVVRGTWQHREQVTPDSTLLNPLWQNESWWTNANPVVHSLHMPRVSTVDRTMLAYFQSPEKACLNIRTRIKSGRYLGKFFPNMPEAERARMAKWQETGVRETSYTDDKLYPLEFATTREEIIDVYNNGPASCMSGHHGWQHNNLTGNLHPAEVYAAGDLAIAYFKRAPGSSDYIARAICWPDKKVFGRIYPGPDNQDMTDIQDAMRNRFLAMGWREDDRSGLNGAKLLKIHTKGGWLMPYLDWGYMVDNEGEHWTMQRHSGRSAENTCGYITARDDDDDDDDDRQLCEACNERCDDTYAVAINARMGSYQNWCESCRDGGAFYCHGTLEYFSDAVSNVEVDGNTYTRRYVEENFILSDLSGEWIAGEVVTMADGDTWSVDEFEERGFTCVITGDNHPNTNHHRDYPDDDISDTCTDPMILEWLVKEGCDDDAAELRAIIEATDTATIPDERQLALTGESQP